MISGEPKTKRVVPRVGEQTDSNKKKLERHLTDYNSPEREEAIMKRLLKLPYIGIVGEMLACSDKLRKNFFKTTYTAEEATKVLQGDSFLKLNRVPQGNEVSLSPSVNNVEYRSLYSVLSVGMEEAPKPMRVIRDNLVLIPQTHIWVQLNGSRGIALLDTGAEINILHSTIADKLGIPFTRIRETMTGIGGL